MDKNSLGNATSTFTDNYSSMISNMGLDASYASANLDSRTTLLSQYKDAESSVSGVNMDEEASNLIVYQNAYSAAARIVTTTSDMLDVLMAM
jgi:flagellar hook-associated protein 1 FlgK